MRAEAAAAAAPAAGIRIDQHGARLVAALLLLREAEIQVLIGGFLSFSTDELVALAEHPLASRVVEALLAADLGNKKPQENFGRIVRELMGEYIARVLRLLQEPKLARM